MVLASEYRETQYPGRPRVEAGSVLQEICTVDNNHRHTLCANEIRDYGTQHACLTNRCLTIEIDARNRLP